jgi:hypothetical protein
MLTLHIFTEERSAKNVFDEILPKILPDNVSYNVYPHQGKQDLEKALKTTVPTISRFPGARILIIRDQDNEDCKTVKERIREFIGERCSSPPLIRIACHKLESWFLGDLNAVSQAYTKVRPEKYQNKKQFRNVDSIAHPDRILLSIIPEYKDRLPKLEVSERISMCLEITGNRSASFNCMIMGIRNLIK